MSDLKYCSFPIAINRLGITSAYELQILVLSATLPKGLKQSNEQLAILFNTHTRSINRVIKRLKDSKYIVNTGSHSRRVLVASDEIMLLFNKHPSSNNTLSGIGDTLSCDRDTLSKTRDNLSENRDITANHNINNIKNIKEIKNNISYEYSPNLKPEYSDQIQTVINRWNKNRKSKKIVRLDINDYKSVQQALLLKGLDYCLKAINDNPKCDNIGQCFKKAM